MTRQVLMLLFDIRCADQPQNIHYARFITDDENILRALNTFRPAANDDYFDAGSEDWKPIKRDVHPLHPTKTAREHQYLKHLAAALSIYLANPSGTELICILGSGYEKDNREALEAWVAYHRNEIVEKRLEGRSPFDYLFEKLNNLLHC